MAINTTVAVWLPAAFNGGNTAEEKLAILTLGLNTVSNLAIFTTVALLLPAKILGTAFLCKWFSSFSATLFFCYLCNLAIDTAVDRILLTLSFCLGKVLVAHPLCLLTPLLGDVFYQPLNTAVDHCLAAFSLRCGIASIRFSFFLLTLL